MQSAKKLRYEVLYKNILRDCRKYYLDLLVEEVGFKTNKSDYSRGLYSKQIKVLVQLSGISEIAIKANVKVSDVEETLKRLIFPRELIKELRVHDQSKKNKIRALYDTLYNFSLQKLNQYAHMETMQVLFYNYFTKFGEERIQKNPNFAKFSQDYVRTGRKFLEAGQLGLDATPLRLIQEPDET